MFNPVDAPAILMAIGRVLRDAADPEQPRDEYRTSQLLSGYSVARHLAAEQAHAADLMAWFRSELSSLLAAANDSGRTPASIPEVAESLASSADRAKMGADLCELLERLRAADEPQAAGLRRRIQRLLRELTDREVAGLSRPPR